VSEEGSLPLQLLDQVRNGCLKSLPLPAEFALESFEKGPLQLDLFLPVQEREEDVLIPPRHGIEEREGVLELDE
jgi:hypothetical protein